MRTNAANFSTMYYPFSNNTNLYNALLKAGVMPVSEIPTGVSEMAKVDESKPEVCRPGQDNIQRVP